MRVRESMIGSAVCALYLNSSLSVLFAWMGAGSGVREERNGVGPRHRVHGSVCCRQDWRIVEGVTLFCTIVTRQGMRIERNGIGLKPKFRVEISFKMLHRDQQLIPSAVFCCRMAHWRTSWEFLLQRLAWWWYCHAFKIFVGSYFPSLCALFPLYLVGPPSLPSWNNISPLGAKKRKKIVGNTASSWNNFWDWFPIVRAMWATVISVCERWRNAPLFFVLCVDWGCHRPVQVSQKRWNLNSVALLRIDFCRGQQSKRHLWAFLFPSWTTTLR